MEGNFWETSGNVALASRFMRPAVSIMFAQAFPSPVPGLEQGIREMELIPMVTCGLLALVMLGCIFRWLARGSRLRRAKKADAEFNRVFRGSAHLLELYQESKMIAGSPRSALYQNVCAELAYQMLGSDVVDKNFIVRLRSAGKITPSQNQAVQRVAQRSVVDASRWFQEKLSGAGVKSLPLLAALGALLNVLEHHGNGTLVAATVCASLWPLALALLLFIIGSGWHRSVVRRAEALVATVGDFAGELAAVLDRQFVDHRQPMESLPSLGGMGLIDGPSFNRAPADVVTRPGAAASSPAR